MSLACTNPKALPVCWWQLIRTKNNTYYIYLIKSWKHRLHIHLECLLLLLCVYDGDLWQHLQLTRRQPIMFKYPNPLHKLYSTTVWWHHNRTKTLGLIFLAGGVRLEHVDWEPAEPRNQLHQFINKSKEAERGCSSVPFPNPWKQLGWGSIWNPLPRCRGQDLGNSWLRFGRRFCLLAHVLTEFPKTSERKS